MCGHMKPPSVDSNNLSVPCQTVPGTLSVYECLSQDLLKRILGVGPPCWQNHRVQKDRLVLASDAEFKNPDLRCWIKLKEKEIKYFTRFSTPFFSVLSSLGILHRHHLELSTWRIIGPIKPSMATSCSCRVGSCACGRCVLLKIIAYF